jgi:hypothetical protein
MTALAFTSSKTLAGCGLTNLNPYVVVKPFTTTYNSNTEKLILMRDPSGTPPYSGDWSKDDTTRWTANTIKDVPLGVDPTNAAFYQKGYFVVPLSKFAYNSDASKVCLAYVQFGINRAGYTRSRYDAEINMSSTSGSGSSGSLVYEPALTQTHFTFNVPEKKGDIYVMVDLYPLGNLPGDCRDGSFSSKSLFGTSKGSSTANVPIVYSGVFSSTQSYDSPSTNPLPKYGY